MEKRKICLETSSYLPLIWCTPYSQSLISLIKSYQDDSVFYLQKDCILEALSYVHYPNNWFRHAPFRLRKLANSLSDKVLERMSFPKKECLFQVLHFKLFWEEKCGHRVCILIL